MPIRLFAALLLAASGCLTACGGGGDTTSSSTSSSTTTAGTTVTAPTITTQPASQTVAEGAAVSFTVVASGSATLSYQWRKGGTAISGATADTLTIAAAGTADAGSYDVVVSNDAGSATSSAATLTVTTASGVTTPTISTAPASLSVMVGASASFSVTATGSTPLTFQWAKDGLAISGATASSLSIAAVSTADAGSYTVTVSNSAGSVTSAAATLTVTSSTSSSGGTHTASSVNAAEAFIATLSSSQQTTAVQTFSLSTARRWSNLPASMVARNGLAWGALSTAQKTAARALIATALGSTGNAMHLGWQAADNYLYANGGGSSYGEGQYYIAFLGTPSTSSFWMLQLTGHHLTFNVAFNGTYRSPTPLFMGIEPKGSFTYGGVTYDPMGTIRAAWTTLGTSLLSYPGAKLSGTYGDLLFGANGSGSIDGTCPRSYSSVTEHGLAYASLSSSDQTLLRAVISAYIATQASEAVDELTAAYLADTALAATYVAYSGSGTMSANGNYFRIEGPRAWIEISVQRGVIFSSDIHYHGIWRDKLADYGGKCIS